jgi:hypothetical protein
MVLSPRHILAAGGATLAAGAAAIAFSGAPADAASTTVSANSVSANWAGYVAQNNNFSSVSGSWIQPSAKCSSPSAYSAFWVGLGGASDQSGALEQVGTQANCSADGSASYYAWYELVPAAPVKLDLAVKPGDRISGRVTVNGTTVVVALTNSTTGQSVTQTLQTDNIDASSAEWIAEAPSACDTSGSCQLLSLADFGTVKFTDAAATAGGHTGAINDAAWQATAVALDGAASGGGGLRPMGVAYADAGAGASGGAQASSLSGDGSAFLVAYESANSTSAASQTTGGDGSGYGYGGGGYGYPGYGYGYGGGGYGYPGYGYDPGPYGYGSAGVTSGGSTASLYGFL